jgi:predicted  nucleic acid-binding Zn-ribbon protein
LLTELSRLIDVQEIDKVIQEVTQGLARLPEELKAGEAAQEELKAAHAARLQELTDLKAQRRDTEMEMADMEEGIKNSRQRLMEIKSNIEYKAMLKEIAFKEDQRDQRETRLLEFMELMETQNRLIAEHIAQLEEQETILVQQRKDVAVQVGKLQKELADLEEKRKKVRKVVPAALMKRYEFIRQRRNSSAVCPVHEGVCLGCHMNILPQQFIDLQKGLEILQCPHCQRILYWADEVGEAGPTSQQAR